MKTAAFACAFSALLSLAPGPQAAAQDPPMVLETTLQRTTGTVAKISFYRSEVVVYGELGYITFSVPEKCPILRGTKEIDLDDIKLGDSIMVQYENPESGTYVAVLIRVSTASS